MAIMENLLSLLVACVAGVGPVAILATLLNRRDRQAEALLHEVANLIPAETLRSDVALSVRCRLLSRRATVRLDLGSSPSVRIWDMATRLHGALPGWVRLEVESHGDGRQAIARPVRITVESTRPAALRPAA